MKRFRKILVWVEQGPGGRVALDQAVAAARQTGAALTLAHAVDAPQRLFRALYQHADELHAFLQREWRERLEEIAAPLRTEGLEVATRLLEGKPFLAIVQEVLRAGHDLLVKPVESSGDTPIFGSTDMHLLRKCPSAVWLTHPEPPPTTRILALVDPYSPDEEIGRRVLQIASSLAEARGARLDVLHVWEAEGERLLASRLAERDLRAYVEKTRERTARELQGLIERAGVALPEDRVHLVKGDVRYAIPGFVIGHEVGLVVLGTLSRAGIHGLLIGNTAETVLARVRCPVLTVKPRGFVSPIELDETPGRARRSEAAAPGA